MLSYQHGYHAGNFADIMKHMSLARILSYLKLKDKPYFYLETHAGKGKYDLMSVQSNKTKEYIEGISKIYANQKGLSDLFKPWLNIINHFNPHDNIKYYPGSPVIASNLSRDQDRLYLCELHPEEFKQLSKLNLKRRRFHISQVDGMSQLKPLLPPPENRGLIFIDPSYEIKSEYKEIPAAIADALKVFSQGIYALWYPMTANHYHCRLNERMQSIKSANKIHVEFWQKTKNKIGMYGCGLWIINPPWTLAKELKIMLHDINKVMDNVYTYKIEHFES